MLSQRVGFPRVRTAFVSSHPYSEVHVAATVYMCMSCVLKICEIGIKLPLASELASQTYFWATSERSCLHVCVYYLTFTFSRAVQSFWCDFCLHCYWPCAECLYNLYQDNDRDQKLCCRLLTIWFPWLVRMWTCMCVHVHEHVRGCVHVYMWMLVDRWILYQYIVHVHAHSTYWI